MPMLYNFVHADFNTTFRRRWVDFFPNPGHLINSTTEHLHEIYDPIVLDLINSLIISDTSRSYFNVSRFAQMIVEAVTHGAGNAVSNGMNETLRLCTIQHLKNSISNTIYYRMVRQLETMQRCMISLGNIEWFLKYGIQNTDFRFPSNCIDRLVYINFCGRCENEIPPLCSNTCGALIRGCYSPYHDALLNQFDIIWNVSIQLLEVLNTDLHDLFTSGQTLFNETMVVSKYALASFNAHLGGVR